MEVQNITSLRLLFEELPVNQYWLNHYHFKKSALHVKVQVGKTSIDNILLNTVATFLFAYGKQTGTESYIANALKLLESLPAENNVITDKFKIAGVNIKDAFSSQGVLQLKKEYCDNKKCLSCGIGIKILKES